VDTHVNYDPTAEQLAEITMAAEEMVRFGLKPKVALLCHSNFGSSSQPSAMKMRDNSSCCGTRRPGWKWTVAKCTATSLWTQARRQIMPSSTLAGDANPLVLPNIDAANISTTCSRPRPAET
jgi:malate dehydrogenase (oxaloacetate-decarboxylating)(NADP+)